MPPRPHLALPSPGTRRAVVVGAGSFGTAIAVILARGGTRTTLQARTSRAGRAARRGATAGTRVYLPGSRAATARAADRADQSKPGWPTRRVRSSSASRRGGSRRSSRFRLGEHGPTASGRPSLSLAKGLVPAQRGAAPSVVLREQTLKERTASR